MYIIQSYFCIHVCTDDVIKKEEKKLIIQTQAPVNLITPSTERQTVFKLGDTITSGLIGTTTVRQRIQREIQTSYDESLIAEQEKDEKRDQIERQQIRKNRVPQEPDVQDDHIVISIRHPALATRHRFFRDDAKMNNVYDWVGSLSPEPMFRKFFCNKTDAASKHSIWRKQKLFYFEDDKEITVNGFQGAEIQK